MKVLLATPTSNKKDYCVNEWLDHIYQFTHPFDIFIVDNSEDPEHRNLFLERGIPCDWCKPEGTPPEYIARSQNMLRNYFLAGDWDYFLSIESDNFPPLDVIELLMSFKKHNVNLPYFLRGGVQATLGVQKITVNQSGLKIAKVMSPADSLLEFDGKLKEYFAPSLGCGLYSRWLMQRLRFRVEKDKPNTFSDSYFHWDSNAIGTKPHVYMGAICQHKRGTWL